MLSGAGFGSQHLSWDSGGERLWRLGNAPVATCYDRCAYILLSDVLLGTNSHLLVMSPEPRACSILPKPSAQEEFTGLRHCTT